VKVIPNIISIFRICLVPVFVIAYFYDNSDIKLFAVLVYAIAGLSDFLDGYLARKLDAQSKLGKLLDPLGDKLMTFTVMVCITIDRPILIWAVLVVAVKEMLLGIGGIIMHKKAHAELLPANALGKTSTFVFFVVCVTLMLFRDIPDIIAIVLVSAAIVLTLIALSSYLNKYIKIMKNREKVSR
jgi:CDP-diacylglycerol--glycerol-3-phosphate 3-phosphatidyltransferase